MISLSMNPTKKNIAHQAIYQWANEILGDGVIIDIGSELGVGLHCLSSKNRHVIGLDIQLEELIFSKIYNNSLQNYYICADGTMIPLSNDFCNGLCLINVLHLVNNPIVILAECWRILSPKGLLIVTIPIDYNLPNEWRIPSEKEHLKNLLKMVFPYVVFPFITDSYEKVSAFFQKQDEANLLTAVCRKDIL